MISAPSIAVKITGKWIGLVEFVRHPEVSAVPGEQEVVTAVAEELETIAAQLRRMYPADGVL